ncbi:hypothetical protein C9J40_20105 [Photobacterium sp. GB-72]|nr:hypothetical protein C9J40_20105 [Photobacterium sp. GB-72]
MLWIALALICLSVLSGVKALKHFDSAFRPSSEKSSSAIVYRFYSKLTFTLFISGITLVAINFVDIQYWLVEVKVKITEIINYVNVRFLSDEADEGNEKLTLYALVFIAITSLYATIQSYLNNRRLLKIEKRIQNLKSK